MEVFSETRSKVNGKFLPEFTGKPITIMGNLIKVHPNGSSFEMKSVDNMVINVILSEPVSDLLEGWVEVRGIGQGRCHVIARHVLPLPENVMTKFDADLFNDIINVINTCNNPWVNT